MSKSKKLKKKRIKKYQPAEARPTIHRYSAETEQKVDSRKKLKRQAILVALFGLPLLLLLWWLL